MVFCFDETKPKVSSGEFLGLLPACLIFLSLNLGIDSPIDRSPNFVKGIHADTIPPTCDSHENTTLFHNNNRFKGHSANEGIRHGGGRSNKGYDVQTLSMTQKQIMGRQECTAAGRSSEVRWGEGRGDRCYVQTKFLKSGGR